MFKFRPGLLNDKKPLKSGNFGDVFPYEEISGGQEWVVKRVLARNINKLNSFLQEVVLGFGCDHPCVLTMKGYFIDQSEDTKYFHIYMKMPRMQMNLLEDLKSMRKQENSYQEEEIIQHFYSIVCGIGYLHSKRIYHGDIKPDNLLLDSQKNLKVADIGIARHFEEDESFQTLSKKIGVYNYLAPEIFGDNVKNDSLPKADIWSIGVVILELCVADFRILNGSNPRAEIQAKINRYFQTLETKYPSSLLGLLKRLLNVNPKERPEIEEIKSELEKNYFRILDEDLLSFGKTASLQNSQNFEDQIALLRQQIKETDSEKRQLQETILAQQQKIEELSERNEELTQCQSLQEEKMSFEKEDQEIEISLRKHRNMSENRIEMTKVSYKELERNLHPLQVRANGSQNPQVFHDLNQLLKQKIEPKEEIFSKDYYTGLENGKLSHSSTQSGANNFGREQGTKTWKSFEKSNYISLYNSYFANSGDIQDEHVVLLSKDILLELHENNLVNLFGLRVNFRNCQQLTEKAFSDFSQVISNKHLHLHYIALDFSECRNFTDKAFSSLASAFSKQVQYLQHLSLSLHACQKITDKSLKSLQKVIMKANLKPKHLTLDFRNCDNLTDQALTNLATALSWTSIKSNLQQLNLNFQECSKFTDKAFSMLAGALCHSHEQLPLRDLTLIFSGCINLTDEAVTSLARTINNPSLHLKNLFLGLSDCRLLTDRGLSKLSKAISSQAEFLQFLTLSFRGCGKLTDQAVSGLAEAISHQSLHLGHLTLGFAECKKLTNQAVLKLAGAISKQSRSLENLSLSFDGCSKLTNHTLEALASTISSQPSHLKHLTLIFNPLTDWCSGWSMLKGPIFLENTDFLQSAPSGAFSNYFSKWIVSSERVHGSENLFKVSKLSDTGVEHLVKAIKSQKNIQELQLSFSEGFFGIGGTVTCQKKESLRKQFAFIPKVHIP